MNNTVMTETEFKAKVSH